MGERAEYRDQLFDEERVHGDVGVPAFDVDREVEEVLVHRIDAGGERFVFDGVFHFLFPAWLRVVWLFG